MSGARRTVVVLAVGTMALGGCAGRTGVGDPATSAEIARWSEPAGIAAELVYVTDVAGFDVATQSVGVVGDDGFAAVYVRSDDDAVATLMLTTSQTAVSDDVPCAGLAGSAAPGPALRCAVERGAVHVALEGDGVDAATLRAAGEAVRVPAADELDDLFADVQVGRVPVERGDLPPDGDGAPINDVGPGG